MNAETQEYILESARFKAYNLGYADAVKRLLGETPIHSPIVAIEEPEDAGLYIDLPTGRKSPEPHKKHRWTQERIQSLINIVESGTSYTVEQLSEMSQTGFTPKAIQCRLNVLGYGIHKGRPIPKGSHLVQEYPSSISLMTIKY